MEPKYGIFPDIPSDQYHDDIIHLSSSQLKVALKDMNEFKYRVLDGNSQPPTKQMEFGSLFHTYLLEPEKFEQECVEFNDAKYDKRTKAFKEYKKEFQEENEGKTILNTSDGYMEQFEQMKLNILSHPDLEKVYSSVRGRVEHSIYWTEENYDQPLRVRPDYLDTKTKTIVDLKTAADITHHGFYNAARYYFNYFLSAAMYLRGVRQVCDSVCDFYFLAVQNKEPYSCAIYKLSEESMLQGSRDFWKALDKIKEAKRRGLYQYQLKLEEI